jgi:GNAT superfamily N-acetyltransferase
MSRWVSVPGHSSACALSRANSATDCIEEIRMLGDGEGYVKGTTLFGPAFVGLRATRSGRVVITDLWVSKTRRGDGLGQRMLDTCIEQADLLGVTLQLRPHAFDRGAGDMSTQKLRTWYARNGFYKVGSELMLRTPQRKETTL